MATAPVVAGWAAAGVLGLYYGVPETDHVVGVAAMVAVLLLVSFSIAPRPSWVLVAGLDVVLPWAALRGAPAGGPALVAGLAVPGLLVLAPLVGRVPGPRSPLVPRATRSVVLVGLQLVFAAVVARQAATSDTIASTRRSPRWPRPVWWSPPASPPDRREAAPRHRHRGWAARADGAGAARHRRRGANGRRPAGALPPGAQRGGGRPFELVKFRTMRAPRPGEVGPQHDAIGGSRGSDGSSGRRASTTLPTLLHVVRGQMALVGPRPLPVEYLARYDDRQARRLEVRPGVTGWAQVNGRNAAGWDERLAMDVWYVDHASTCSTPGSSSAPSAWCCAARGSTTAPASR